MDHIVKDAFSKVEGGIRSSSSGPIDFMVGDELHARLRVHNLFKHDQILSLGKHGFMNTISQNGAPTPACAALAEKLYDELERVEPSIADSVAEQEDSAEQPSVVAASQQQTKPRGRFVHTVCLVSLSPVVTTLLTPQRRHDLFLATVTHLEKSGKLKDGTPGVLTPLNNGDLPSDCRHSVFSRDPNENKNEKLTDPSARQAITVNYRLYSGGNDCMGTWGCEPLGKYVASLTVGFGDSPLEEEDAVRKEVTVMNRHDDYKPPEKDDDKKELEELSHNHRLLSFIDFYTTAASGERAVGWLDDRVVEKGLAAAARKVDNQHLIDTVKTLFLRMTDASLPHPRGLLLWGPPGTGKTTVAEALGGSLGLVPVREDGGFAAGELMAGLQGGTEKNVMAILQRAWSAPWLMFCVFVDEVETLVPNRNNKEASSGGAGSSVLGVLLTYFGGTRIPNIFMFGATNMKLDIDAAFDRRMSGKIFVGLPTSRARRNWEPRKGNGAVDSSIDLSGVRDAMSRMTMNFSGANMGMLMTELKLLASRQRRRAQPDQQGKSLAVSAAQLSTAIGDVCDRERILFGSVSIPRLIERSDESSENASFLKSFTCVSDILLQFRAKWTGRAFLNLSSAYIGKAEKDNCPYLDFEMRGQKVHTFRQQSFDQDTKETPSLDVFKRVLIDLGLALDMNAVKLIDNSFFLKEALKDENDIVHRIADEVMQCHEYQRSMVILDLDAAFVDVNFEDSMAHETIHRSAVFNTMLSVAREFARCEKRLESHLFIVCVTTYECVAQRFEYSSQWPKNLMRQRQIDAKDFAATLQQCSTCLDYFVPDEVRNKADCQMHDATAQLVKKKDAKNGTAATGVDTKLKSQLDPSKDDCSAYHYTCCGANYFTKRCGKNAQEHIFRDPPQEGGEIKFHPCSDLATASWCNVCSQFASGRGATPADCTQCSPSNAICRRPALPGKTLCQGHLAASKIEKAAVDVVSAVGADDWKAKATLWWTVDPASKRRIRLPLKQAQFMAFQDHLYSTGKLNDTALIELPWNDFFPDHRIHKFRGDQLKIAPNSTETLITATRTGDPSESDPNPELSTKLIRLTPKWRTIDGGQQVQRCQMSIYCSQPDPEHFRLLKH